MPDNLRITVDEVRKRMEAGEDFVLIDTRNPQAWSQSDVKLPEAVRLPLDSLDENLSKIPKDKSPLDARDQESWWHEFTTPLIQNETQIGLGPSG